MAKRINGRKVSTAPPVPSQKKEYKKGPKYGRITTRMKKEVRHRVYEEERRSHTSSTIRDIFPIDFTTIDWKRRLSAKLEPEVFFKTYMPNVFKLGFSENHHKVIAKGRRVILEGGKFCVAMERGGGKTAICRGLLLWGTAYGHVTFPFLVGSRDDKATASLDLIKTYWYRSVLLRQDFPEIAMPIHCLEGRWQKASGQVFRDEPTHIYWGTHEVQYPCLIMEEEDTTTYLEHDPESVVDLAHYGYPGKFTPRSSGCIIRTSGITGSIRGEAEVHPIFLTQPRPDCVLLDDLQKDQSADSPLACENLMKLIDGAVEGLSGPQELLSCLMPCTVIREGDVSDTYLDQHRKPEWNGEKCGMVSSWPTGITDEDITNETIGGKHWNHYAELRVKSLRLHGDISLATQYYADNRKQMDSNFRVSWKHNYNKAEKYKGNKELSAQQHAMNLRLANPLTFCAEYLNRPRNPNAGTGVLITAAQLCERTTNIERNALAVGWDILVCFIDVQDEILFYGILACDHDFNGQFIDYGTWPECNTRYFRKNQTKGWSLLSRNYYKHHPDDAPGNAQHKKNRKHLRAPFDQKIYFSLKQACVDLLSRQYVLPDQHGNIMTIQRLGIDARWGQATDAIRRFIAEFNDRRVIPYFGQGVRAASLQFEEFKRHKGQLFEDNLHPHQKEVRWIYRPSQDGGYHMLADVNRLKSFLMQRLAVPMGGQAAITLFKGEPEQHRLFADHVCNSEYPEVVEARSIKKDEWMLKPDNPFDNDFLDVATGCMALASYEGASVKHPDRELPPLTAKKSLSAIWKSKGR